MSEQGLALTTVHEVVSTIIASKLRGEITKQFMNDASGVDLLERPDNATQKGNKI